LGIGSVVFGGLLISGTAKGSTIFDSGFGFSSTIQTSATNSTAGDEPPNIIVLNSPSDSYSANQTASMFSTGFASVALTSGAGNVGLHGSASGDAPAQSQGTGQFDIYFYDAFNISGTGYQTFQYSLTLDGSATIVGDPLSDLGYSGVAGGLSLFANSSYQGLGNVQPNPGCSGIIVLNYTQDQSACSQIATIGVNTRSGLNVNGGTVTGEISILGGTTIELGIYLFGDATAYNFDTEDPGSADIYSQFNAADTGYFTLTPISQGASFTTQSGLTYTQDPDSAIPEPASAALLLIGIAGLCAARRRWSI
jgi:hypothetical protein